MQNCISSKENAMLKDMLWAVSLSRIEKSPMWIGFSCSTTRDESEMQKVEYLPQINSSPTSYSVVRETLIQASKIAVECHQAEIICTYDLAIAKMAKQIQVSESPSPRFDHIFINLGGFHLQLAFFKAVGKYIDGSGIAEILISSEVLAEGSINSFLEGKHFNRCKRIHPYIVGALRVLHFERFAAETQVDEDLLIADLETAMNNPCTPRGPLDISSYLNNLLRKYKFFCSSTLAGAHGKTAQYYLQYVQMIEYFFRFSRSIRSSDFELYLDSIYEMGNFFFLFNQPNYARWSMSYVSDLLNLQLTNSNLLGQFSRGAFGIKRTKGPLARSPIDLTLEQTVNADAANSLTGISHFTNSISARQRWALSHSLRTTVTSKLLESVGITRKDDVAY